MLKFDSGKPSKKEYITVGYFFNSIKDRFKLSSLTGEIGFEKKIIDQNLHRPGLALAGFVELFSYKRVQIFGNTEMKYLAGLSKEKRLASLETFFSFDIPCVIITNNNTPFPELLELAKNNNTALFITPYETTKLVYLVGDFLEDQFALTLSVHGSFVDVYGIGILFVGKSGIGKSEVALDLVERGHRLVADDVVLITKKSENILIGTGANLFKHFMELRGVGFIDIKSIFGVRAIRYQKRVELLVELELWDDKANYTRTGLETEYYNILDVEIPYVKLPIVPGKNITVIAEVIALNYLLKHYGYNSAEVMQRRLQKKLRGEFKEDEKIIDYFEHDFE